MWEKYRRYSSVTPLSQSELMALEKLQEGNFGLMKRRRSSVAKDTGQRLPSGMKSVIKQEVNSTILQLREKLKEFVEFVKEIQDSTPDHFEIVIVKPLLSSASPFTAPMSSDEPARDPLAKVDPKPARAAVRDALRIVQLLLVEVVKLLDEVAALTGARDDEPFVAAETPEMNACYAQYVFQVTFFALGVVTEQLKCFAREISEAAVKDIHELSKVRDKMDDVVSNNHNHILRRKSGSEDSDSSASDPYAGLVTRPVEHILHCLYDLEPDHTKQGPQATIGHDGRGGMVLHPLDSRSSAMVFHPSHSRDSPVPKDVPFSPFKHSIVSLIENSGDLNAGSSGMGPSLREYTRSRRVDPLKSTRPVPLQDDLSVTGPHPGPHVAPPTSPKSHACHCTNCEAVAAATSRAIDFDALRFASLLKAEFETLAPHSHAMPGVHMGTDYSSIVNAVIRCFCATAQEAAIHRHERNLLLEPQKPVVKTIPKMAPTKLEENELDLALDEFLTGVFKAATDLKEEEVPRRETEKRPLSLIHEKEEADEAGFSGRVSGKMYDFSDEEEDLERSFASLQELFQDSEEEEEEVEGVEERRVDDVEGRVSVWRRVDRPGSCRCKLITYSTPLRFRALLTTSDSRSSAINEFMSGDEVDEVEAEEEDNCTENPEAYPLPIWRVASSPSENEHLSCKLKKFYANLVLKGFLNGPHLILRVRRYAALEEAFDTMMTPSEHSLAHYRSVRVVLAGYSDTDSDRHFPVKDIADTLELFSFLSEQLLSQRVMHLMELASEASGCLFPNPSSASHPEWFHFAGLVLALSLLHRIPLQKKLALCFYKELLGRPTSLEDVAELDPSLYARLRHLLAVDVEGLSDRPCFVVRERSGCGAYDAELLPGGRGRLVSNASKGQYVALCKRWVLRERCRAQMDDIRSGFLKVLDPSFLADFTVEEIQELVARSPQSLLD